MNQWTPRGQALGEVVCERRRELGMSQEDLARAAGLSLAYIKLLERGMCGDLLSNLSPELADAFKRGEEEGAAQHARRARGES